MHKRVSHKLNILKWLESPNSPETAKIPQLNCQRVCFLRMGRICRSGSILQQGGSVTCVSAQIISVAGRVTIGFTARGWLVPWLKTSKLKVLEVTLGGEVWKSWLTEIEFDSICEVEVDGVVVVEDRLGLLWSQKRSRGRRDIDVVDGLQVMLGSGEVSLGLCWGWSWRRKDEKGRSSRRWRGAGSWDLGLGFRIRVVWKRERQKMNNAPFYFLVIFRGNFLGFLNNNFFLIKRTTRSWEERREKSKSSVLIFFLLKEFRNFALV